ncbi:hypothetical protein KAURM247S_06369 [Kitasatospora aureofaciens]
MLGGRAPCPAAQCQEHLLASFRIATAHYPYQIVSLGMCPAEVCLPRSVSAHNGHRTGRCSTSSRP